VFAIKTHEHQLTIAMASVIIAVDAVFVLGWIRNCCLRIPDGRLRAIRKNPHAIYVGSKANTAIR
jgi:hypothetical protein